MKKILFVIESLHLGGAEKSLVTLLQNLDYTLYEVDLITFHKEGFFTSLVPNGVNTLYIPSPKISILDRIKYVLKRKSIKGYHHAQLFWPIVRKYFKLQKTTYDIAIAYNQGFATYFVNENIEANKKIAWLNTDYQKAGYNIKFDYPFYIQFKKIIAVSPEAKASLEGALSAINKSLNIEIIKDISDKQEILKKGEEALQTLFDNQCITIVTIARLVKGKGLHMALEAAKLLKDKGYKVKWYIVGEGGERSVLESTINQLHLQDAVVLIGATINPYPYIKACDIYVQTSLFEGLGLSVIEATYFNKPIVCTNFPTAYGILEHQETGLICEMNARAISDAVVQLIVDEELRNKLIYNLSLKENSDKDTTLNLIKNVLLSND